MFLKDSQELLKKYKKTPDKYIKPNYETIIDIWNEIKNDTGFKEKYYYIDWTMWEFLNKSEHFLQFMSIYNMASPIISLFIPIIIFIIPFFVLKLKVLNVTMYEYINILKIVISNQYNNIFL